MVLNADLARELQRTMLDDAAARRMARGTRTTVPHYREWLARRLVVLALRIAPSLRGSFLTVTEHPFQRIRLNPPPTAHRSGW